MYVANQRDLAALCAALQPATRIAIDTEFVGENSYVPRLEIIQVAAPGVEAIIDFQALNDLGCLTDILLKPTVEKVLHAGGQDLDIFLRLIGQVPAPIFDTQVAASFLGFGSQPGLASLVEKLLGRHVSKAETLTDWSQRPLTAAQQAYALEDVRYLLTMRERLGEMLASRGRTHWVEDEFARMTDPASYVRREPEEVWQRVKGASGLRPRELSVLRELAAWREEEARRRDRPRGAIMRDEVLIGLARKAPATLTELQDVRGIYPREVERSGREMLAAVKRGLSVPRNQAPQFPQRPILSGQQSALMELLQSLLRARAEEHDFAPNLIATTGDLQTLIESRGRDHTLPLLQGWRRELVGADLLALIEGRAALVWDSQKQTLRLISVA
jgi:ribonuclease D